MSTPAVRGIIREVGAEVEVVQPIGIILQVLGLALVGDLASHEHVGAVADRQCEGGELFDEQHADAIVGETADDRDQALDHGRRQAERHLVEQQHTRSVDQRPRDHEHLLLTARQERGARVAAVLQLGEQVEPGVDLRSRRAHEEVLLDGQVREDRPTLFDVCESEAGTRAARCLGDVVVAED